MTIQASDMLYRRHQQEWAAFRDAVSQSENQKRITSDTEETATKLSNQE